jgi:hypothetical protein
MEPVEYAEDGLPVHLIIPVDENGDGPVPEDETDHWACWCGDEHCTIPC